MPAEPYVAVTDPEWFASLQALAGSPGRLDEVNFWNPSGAPLKDFRPGDPIFLRLGGGRNVIAGYGFFAHFTRLRLDLAWDYFGRKNGAADPLELRRMILSKRQEGPVPAAFLPEIGCTVLRDPMLWSQERWFTWGDAEGWHRNQQRGKTERDPRQASRLLGEIAYDHAEAPDELVKPFHPEELDERKLVLAHSIQREGQGAFRTRLLDAYGRRCAITGERTEPVLDAAHIQPYLGPRSNHIQNGLLLTKEFHTLFDLGYVTVTAALEVRVSPRLRAEWHNGGRYYPYDGRRLVQLPGDVALRPSPLALEWHARQVFRG